MQVSAQEYLNTKNDYSYTQNREISWLRFNERVLDEADDKTVPLLERLKFASIFTSNLDEFFMVRIGSLYDLDLIAPDNQDNKTGQTPKQQLNKAVEAVKPLILKRDAVYEDIMIELAQYGIRDLKYEELSKSEREYVDEYYSEYISPILSPQIINSFHPFPHLRNKDLHIAALLSEGKKEYFFGIVTVPSNIEPLLFLPDCTCKFIRIENIILAKVQLIFDVYKVVSANIISVTRNADIPFDREKFDDDENDYKIHMSNLLKKRARLAPVRLEIQGECDKRLEEVFCTKLGLNNDMIFKFTCPISLKYAFSLAGKLSETMRITLTYPAFKPHFPECINKNQSIISQIQKHDILLFYPYDQISPFVKFLQEASTNPDVVSIKITLYRISDGSQIAHQLCAAAENGKDVTVLVELRARFDEENNIQWAERLEQAGCRIIYGAEGFKCHSKICLVTLNKNHKISYITQIGTGNYNEKTASMYTDLSLMTSDKEIGLDAAEFFRNMLIGNLYGSYKKLLVAPSSLKSGIMRLIDDEILKGPKGRIVIKANSLTERDVIDRLAIASQAGVKITLILRGICCLVPGIPGKTDNISVISIVGRFLEHSRIYRFGEGENEKIFIASADMMTRNLSRRVEIACPILKPEIKKQLSSILEIILKDNVKARTLMTDGTYCKMDSDGSEKIDSQKWFMENSIKSENKPDEEKHLISNLNNFISGFFKK